MCGGVRQKFQDDPQVVYCRALAEKGSKVVCVEDGLPTWVAEARLLSTNLAVHAWVGCIICNDLCRSSVRRPLQSADRLKAGAVLVRAMHGSLMTTACARCAQIMVWDPDVHKAISKVLDIERQIQELIEIT